MKRIYLFIAVFFAAGVASLNVHAQTDVTATYLSNAGFETTPTGVAADNTIYDVAGWTEFPVAGPLTFYKLATVAYGSVTAPLGTIPANGSSVTTDNTSLLGIKRHWGPGELYVQQIVSLPAGKYSITWDSYLGQVVTSQESRCGVVIDGVATYDNLPTAINTWKNHSLTFTIASAKDVTIRMGYNKPDNVGGGSTPILFVDNVKLALLPVDKVELQNQIVIATAMYASQQPVGTSTAYADLSGAIASAQLVNNNASATAEQVLTQEAVIKTAIVNVNNAIILQSRAATWTTFPYNATSVITNPNFELNNTSGWENPNGFSTNNSPAIGATKVGTYFAEKWVPSPGILVNLKLSQVITNVPNGVYAVTVGAQAKQETATPSYPGKAYIFANTDSTEVFIANNYTVKTIVTNNTLRIGFVTKTTGNWVAVDNFLLSYLGSPKSLLKSLIESANVMLADPKNVGSSTAYTDLTNAKAAATLVYNNASATPTEIATQETAMNKAISNLNGAIILQTRKDTWTTLPLDVTSAITNPSFETNATEGWTNPNAFVAQNNTSLALKAGTYYVEKWQGSGSWTGLKLSQKIVNIPNGVYTLTAAALNEPSTTGGAFVFANDVRTEVFTQIDYSVTATVTNNELEVGYDVVNGGNWVAVDNFRLIYKGSTPTSINQTVGSDIQVYPTVTDGSIQVNLGGKSGFINVYDITGKRIQYKTANSSIETLTLPSKGMYLVEVSSANTTKTVKVIKTK
jgi:hypothetical protein